MEKKILIIIDAQRDFCDKNGALYVPNAEIAIDNIISFINKNKEMIEQVVFTTDNHPADHCSFKKNGGIWPEHCVQHTYGRAIMLPLLECCDDNDLLISVIKKGENKDEEEYTAFSRSEKIGNTVILKSATASLTVDIDKFIVCGFAGDYCVKDSIADLIKVVGAENVEVFKAGIANIDSGYALNEFCEDNNIKSIDL